MTRTSSRHPVRPASKTIRPSLGSSGSWASLRPMALRRGPPSLPSPNRLTTAAPAGARGGERPQLFEEGYAVGYVAPVRGFHKREIFDVPQADGCHLKDHRRQVRPQYLRLGEGPAAGEVLL